MNPGTYAILFILTVCLVTTRVKGQDLANIRKKDAFKLTGSFNVGYWQYQANGIENRRNPYGWYISGSPNISLFGVNFPFSAVISAQERSYSQPFNQIGVSPYYKWIKLHAGYRNLTYSEFTLGGATFLGGAVELTPAKFRFSAFYGRLRRRVASDSSLFFSILPSYERWAYGGKIGAGGKNGFCDFIFLRSADRPKESDLETFPVKPEENIVLGLNLEQTLFKRIRFGTNLAASVLTANTFLDTLYADSLDGFERFSFVNKAITLNASTNVKFASNSFVQLKLKNQSVKFSYRYVEPGYMSHGANYLQDDLKQYLLSTNFSMFKQKVIVGASGGVQYNNLDRTKAATSERTIGSVNVLLMAGSSTSIQANYSNFGTSTTGRSSLLNDSVLLSLVNQNVGFGVTHTWVKTKTSHQVGLNALLTTTSDRNEFTRVYTQNDLVFGSINYSLGISKIKLSVGSGCSYTTLSSYANHTKIPGANFSLRKGLLKNNLNLSVNYTYQVRMVNSIHDGNVQTVSADVRYSLKKHNSFLLGLAHTDNTSSLNSPSFNETRLRIQYGYTF